MRGAFFVWLFRPPGGRAGAISRRRRFRNGSGGSGGVLDAEESHQQSGVVADRATEMSFNVQAVAATEELATSASEIGVHHSTLNVRESSRGCQAHQ